jgi:hypothetical protein
MITSWRLEFPWSQCSSLQVCHAAFDRYIEPTSFLQRLCEPFLCSNLLDQAAATTSGADAELERLALIATFFVSAHCNNIRSYKPFNPLLGETFEYVREGEHPFKFIAEQVSHHPPIAATHAHNDKWEMWDEKRFGSKFGGNSLTMTPLGKFHLVLKTTDEHFTFEAVTCTAHNVIVGTTWVEHHGTTVVRNLKTGSRAEVTLEKSGWISRSRYDTKVSIYDAAGTERMTIDGKWTEAMTLHQKGKPDRVLWKAEPSPPNKYGFSAFAEELNRIGDVRQLPATDSRLRADRMWLAKGEMEKAGAAKKTIENKQREAKKLRVAANKNWIPRFFVPAAATDDDPNEWHFNGRYWAIRERRLKEATDAQSAKKRGKSAAATNDNDDPDAAVTAGKSPRKADAAVNSGKSPRKAAADDDAAPAASNNNNNNDDEGHHSEGDDSLTGTEDDEAEPSTPRTKAAKAEEKKKKRAQRRKAHN